ncbi:MAG: aromatic ring-hydroxylating dioxygenase subunit alpha [Gammaproteobacteria bacterium]|nr:aromatic ring-hydroxylating dioxygenase subunit alpha [Gammaproteobacteria bacterium]
MSREGIFATDFNGLTEAQPTLPFAWYYDRDQYQRELDTIWSQNWVYLCRADSVTASGDYRVFALAGHEVILLRDDAGELCAYFNSCRHRGSRLCEQGGGSFKRGRIICPYHSWSYDLRGRLVATGSARTVAGFDPADHGLSPVAIASWGGFVFANLAGADARPFAETLGEELSPLNNWPLASLRVGHRFSKTLACNWKLFWENFNECLHCPRVHPGLCQLVPIYGRGLMVRKDDPHWRDRADDDNARVSGRLRAGAETWSPDGRAAVAAFTGLTEAEKGIGHTYAVAMPSLFVVGHVDYVRSVQITPLDSERMRLDAEWLFAPEALDDPGLDLPALTAFAEQVMLEDGQACELNQRGLRSASASHGILMSEEYEVFAFQEWVRCELGEAPLAEARASRASRRKERG